MPVLTETVKEMKGYKLHLVNTEKYKTNTIVWKMKAPLTKEDVTFRALLPHVLQSSSQKYPTTTQLRSYLDELYGTSLYVDLAKKGEFQIMSFTIEVANEKFLTDPTPLLQKALEFLAEILNNPHVQNQSFDNEIVEKEKKTLKQRIQSVFDDKMRYSNLRLVEEMFKDEPYSLHVNGQMDDVDSISAENLYQYYQRTFQEDEMDLYVIGDVNENDVEQIANKLFQFEKRTPKQILDYDRKNIQSVNEVKEEQEIKQGKLNIGYRTNVVYGDSDYFALQVFNGIFGGFSHSKLFINVREKASLAYYASSRMESHKGIMMVMSGIDTNHYDQAVKIIHEQMEAMRNGDFTEDELAQTNAVIENQLLETIDTSRGIVEILYHNVIGHIDIRIENWMEEMKKVTKEDIVAVAKKIELDTIYFFNWIGGGEKMKKITFDQLQEELFYEKMPNGLDVYILPKKGFNKTYATFTTKYGSIDNHFVVKGETEFTKVPDGIAHFLEHKLFEKEEGDVFQQFSKQGASANAFTSFTRTAYLFSSTSNFVNNLETLIDFVQDPYFSEKTVEKEKGIIGQEITMYDDNPDWRLYFGLIQNMYKNHPVSIDIAGTIDSIAKITKDMLYQCYNTFYHPSNMLLFVVGPVEVESTMNFIKENQAKKPFDDQSEIKRKFEEEPNEVAEKKKVLQMNVQSSKCLIGIKALQQKFNGEEMLKNELSINLLLDLLFGKSSDNYQKLYTEGLIDETFSYDYTLEQGFGFAMLGGDTSEPDRLADSLEKMLVDAAKGNGISDEGLNKAKKKKIGAFLRSVNSPEYIANQFTRYAFNDMNLFDVVPTLEKITLDEVKTIAMEFISEDRFSVCQVVPKK